MFFYPENFYNDGLIKPYKWDKNIENVLKTLKMFYPNFFRGGGSWVKLKLTDSFYDPENL